MTKLSNYIELKVSSPSWSEKIMACVKFQMLLVLISFLQIANVNYFTSATQQSQHFYFGLMLSLSDDDQSSGALAGVQAALDEINSRDNLLTRYSLNFTLTNSKVMNWCIIMSFCMENTLIFLITVWQKSCTGWIVFSAISSSSSNNCIDWIRLLNCQWCHCWNLSLLQSYLCNRHLLAVCVHIYMSLLIIRDSIKYLFFCPGRVWYCSFPHFFAIVHVYFTGHNSNS